MLVSGFLGVWRILLAGRLWRMLLHQLFVALRQEDRNIYERNVTRALGRFSDIKISMRHA